MQGLRKHVVIEQLNLLDQFDKFAKRDERLVNELLSALANFKYFRVNTRFSELKEKKEIESILGQVLYWTAFLSFKKARFVETYKGKNLDYFLSLTKDVSHINVTEPIDPETITGYYMNGHKRLKTTFMAYKDLLVDDRTITKRILDNFDSIHDLTHAV